MLFGYYWLLPVTAIFSIIVSAGCDHSPDSSPIYYNNKKPSWDDDDVHDDDHHLKKTLTTTMSFGRQKIFDKGCIYNNQPYIHGAEVPIDDQPCLQCVCKKGVLLCSMKVCPPILDPSGKNSDQSNRQICEIFHDQNNRCCPTVRCTTNTTMMIDNNESDITTTADPLDVAESFDPIHHVVNTNATTIIQTAPSYYFEEPPKESSPLLVASPSQHRDLVTDSDDGNESPPVIEQLGQYCHLNGTYYGEGSAIMSNSQCNYCYCLRGRKMCIRPRCHLSILGCIPKYTSQYSCCPTSYSCSQNYDYETDAARNSTKLRIKIRKHLRNNSTLSKGGKLTKLGPGFESSRNRSSLLTTTTTTTTTTPAPSGCRLNGTHYSIGAPMPSDSTCTQCFCQKNGSRTCSPVHCDMPDEPGCVPVIPDDQCCPTEFKCSQEPSVTTVFPAITTMVDGEEFTTETLPPDDPSGQRPNELQKSMRGLDTGGQKKARPLFANGWRAVPVPKYKLPPPVRPNFDQVKSNNETEDSQRIKIDIDAYSVKCVIEGKQFSNGEIIPNTEDPCIYCRCFYGKKMCQEQKCPPAPSLDCFAERKPNQCCPLYTCKTKTAANESTTTITSSSTSPPPPPPASEESEEIRTEASPIRRGPQFSEEIDDEESGSKKSSAEQPLPEAKSFSPIQGPPQGQPRIPLPIHPFELIYNGGPENRIHFPGPPADPKRKLFPSPVIPPLEVVPNAILNRQQLNKHLYELLTKEQNSHRFQSTRISDSRKPDSDKPIRHHHPAPIVPPPPPPQALIPILAPAAVPQIPITPSNAPIRPLPQSPTQIGKPNPSEPKAPQPPMDRPSPPPPSSTTSTTPSTTTTTPTTTTTTTTTTTMSPMLTSTPSTKSFDLLPSIFQVSGCNIYGKMYKTDEEIKELSSACKQCMCSIIGVKCTQVC